MRAETLVQSLHVLFSLFMHFRSSQHFKRARRQSLLDRMQTSLQVRPITPPVYSPAALSSLRPPWLSLTVSTGDTLSDAPSNPLSPRPPTRSRSRPSRGNSPALAQMDE